MDETLIENWNSVVADKDTVYHLGDFSFRNSALVEDYLTRLRGHIHLIPGNHDSTTKKVSHLFDCVHRDITRIKIPGYHVSMTEMVLCHYPLLSWNKSPYGIPHFFGHIHSGPHKPFSHPYRALDVGVDANNYFPLSLEEAIKKLLEKS